MPPTLTSLTLIQTHTVHVHCVTHIVRAQRVQYYGEKQMLITLDRYIKLTVLKILGKDQFRLAFPILSRANANTINYYVYTDSMTAMWEHMPTSLRKLIRSPTPPQIAEIDKTSIMLLISAHPNVRPIIHINSFHIL